MARGSQEVGLKYQDKVEVGEVRTDLTPQAPEELRQEKEKRTEDKRRDATRREEKRSDDRSREKGMKQKKEVRRMEEERC